MQFLILTGMSLACIITDIIWIQVRIIFHWITAQDLNAINFPPDIREDTPLAYLLDIKLNKKQYSGLFSRMCK